MKILITGMSGFLGEALKHYLVKQGHDVYGLSRTAKKDMSKTLLWDPEKHQLHAQDLEGFEAVINLAGENIAGYWTHAKKERILSSRVESTRLLVKCLKDLQHPPQVLLNASAVGYYGSQEARILDENSPAGEGFLAKVCKEWEEAASQVEEKGIRAVYLRISTVLGSEGGVLSRLLPIFNWGMGGALGTGSQYMSWIAIEDFVRAIEFLMGEPALRGAVNVCSPYPVTHKEFTKILGKKLKRPTFMSAPAPLLRLVLGEMSQEVLLSSIRAQPMQLERAGYHFLYPRLEEALDTILEPHSTS
jgi:uncharacterized protein (TIGR01777 family)